VYIWSYGGKAMARTARGEVFEATEVGVYHVYNRVVRRCFLWGVDPVSGKDFSYRQGIVVRRLRLLSQYFALEVLGYAVLSNHFHLVVRNRPDRVASWSDRQVAWRWLMICPAKRHPDESPVEPTEAQLAVLLADPEKLQELRRRLSNPSWLMGRACQYIARRCNREDQHAGRFFEERFKMKRLLDEAAVLACLAYVDLNPLRAGATDRLDGEAEVSIAERMRQLDGSSATPADWLVPMEDPKPPPQAPVPCPEEVESAAGAKPAEAAAPNHPSPSGEQASADPSASRGTLPFDLRSYVELLGWLAAGDATEAASQQQPREGPQGDEGPTGKLLPERLGLDATAFAAAVRDYERRFRTVVGGPASVERERRRRRRKRLHAPGRGDLNPRSS